MLPPEKLQILSQGRGPGRNDRRTMEGGSRQIKSCGREASTFVPGQPWTDAEDEVTALQSSFKLSKHFPNKSLLPTKGGTEMWIQRAKANKRNKQKTWRRLGGNVPSLGTVIKKTFSFSPLCFRYVFYISPSVFKVPHMRDNITIGKLLEIVWLIVSTQ